MSKLDPLARCPASGLLNVQCMGSICDCFPEEDDRFGIHPEYFQVGSVTPEERQALTEYLEAEHGPVPPAEESR